MKKTVICTVCPKEDAVLTGYTCKRGIPYAIDECFEPKRTFTSSVKISGSDRRVLPVRTDAPIPKSLLMQAAEAINKIELKVPVACGDVIVENFLDTGVNLVSSMSL